MRVGGRHAEAVARGPGSTRLTEPAGGDTELGLDRRDGPATRCWRVGLFSVYRTRPLSSSVFGVRGAQTMLPPAAESLEIGQPGTGELWWPL